LLKRFSIKPSVAIQSSFPSSQSLTNLFSFVVDCPITELVLAKTNMAIKMVKAGIKIFFLLNLLMKKYETID